MSNFTPFAFLLLILLSAGSGLGQDTWKKIDNQFFSFSVPPTLEKTELHGIDSFVQEYKAVNIKIVFDYGLYSNNFEDWPKETKFENLMVDGRPARIGTVKHEFHEAYPFSTQIYIKLNENDALSMFAACKTEKEVSLARKIFETIVFKKGN